MFLYTQKRNLSPKTECIAGIEAQVRVSVKIKSPRSTKVKGDRLEVPSNTRRAITWCMASVFDFIGGMFSTYVELKENCIDRTWFRTRIVVQCPRI